MNVRRGVASSITKRYVPTVALRGVSCEVRAGELTLIEGANGSGKSTLLGILGSVVKPSAGEVTLELDDDTGCPVADGREHLGWLSHESLAYGDLTGRQNVELAARLHGCDVGRAWEAAAERFELGAFALRPLKTNSRGQRQRVALARALVHAPGVVLLDEPTTGLDRVGVERLQRVVAEEVARGAAVAVVTHDPALFSPARRLPLEGGRLVSRGT